MNNFKIVETKAFTKAEALNQVVENNGIQVIKDATQAWKNAGKPVTDKELRKFCAEYLQENTKFASGIGCSITVESGVADSRERPYKVNDIKNEQGKRKFKKAIQGINPATGEVLFTVTGTKNEAKEAAKELYTKHGYTGNVYAQYIHIVESGEVGAFEVEYAPSKSAKQGTYLVFGVER